MDNINVPSINYILISGRLTNDADLRFTSDNNGVINFRLVNSRRYRDKNGEWKEITLFINVNYWGSNYIEKLNQKLKKGTPVIIEGNIQLNTWEDKNSGEKRSSYQIRAYKIHVLTREVSDKHVESNNYVENVNEKINEIDKEFHEIADNENIGGDDDFPF